MTNDGLLARIGAPIGGIGFLLLFVEALRVVFGKSTLTGIESVLPWVGLGLLVVGAILLAAAALGDLSGPHVAIATPDPDKSERMPR